MKLLEKQWDALWNYFTGPELWASIGSGFVRILVIVILSTAIVKITRTFIDRFFVNRGKGPIRITERRENTLKRLMKNVIAYVVYFIAIVMILDVFNIPVGSLLAGAGVAGLAIGFGAQNLVRDIISGFFIVFEDQFSVGDYVTVSGVEGTVEEIGLRTTKILSWTGEMNVLPNGDITQVTNYSIRNGLSLVDINVPYESDVSEAEAIIEKVVASLPSDYDIFVDVPVIHGVQRLDQSHYVIRVIAETLPTFQWKGERIIRREVQDKLYKSGIEIPSPRLVMYSSEQKQELLNREHERDN